MLKKGLIFVVCIVIIFIVLVLVLYSRPTVAVLGYHNILSHEEKKGYMDNDLIIDLEHFKAQLNYLKKHNYKTLTLDEYYCWQQNKCDLPRKSVLITFDDGFVSNYYYVFPLLKEYNMNGVIFVVGSAIRSDSVEWSVDKVGHYMSYEQIEESREKYPNIEFASHSYNLHISGAAKNGTYEELSDDCKKMKSILDSEYYAYPYGSKSDNMVKALKDNGYSMAFGFGPRENHRKSSRSDDKYFIPRLNIDNNIPLWKFIVRLEMPF